MIALTVVVVAAPIENVAVPVRAMPRLALRVKAPVVARVAVPIVSWPGVAEPGAVPRPVSAAIERIPALIVVAPLYVLIPDSVSVLAPALIRLPLPAMIPL